MVHASGMAPLFPPAQRGCFSLRPAPVPRSCGAQGRDTVMDAGGVESLLLSRVGQRDRRASWDARWVASRASRGALTPQSPCQTRGLKLAFSGVKSSGITVTSCSAPPLFPSEIYLLLIYLSEQELPHQPFFKFFLFFPSHFLSYKGCFSGLLGVQPVGATVLCDFMSCPCGPPALLVREHCLRLEKQ